MPETTLNGVNIYYELKGDLNSNKVIFFLNGVMASTNSWALMLPAYEKAGYKIVLHDFRGQFKSEKPESPWTFQDHIEDMVCLMDFLKIEKASFIGTSYGGEAALYFAVNYPDKCNSIVIIDSASELNTLLEIAVSSWITAAETGNAEAFFRLILPWIYSNSYLEKNKTELLERAKLFADLPPDYLKGQIQLYKTFLELDITKKLYQIKAPALVVCGENDILKPAFFSKIISKNIPESKLVILPDCGHVAIFEKYNELNNIIINFFTENVFS